MDVAPAVYWYPAGFKIVAFLLEEVPRVIIRRAGPLLLMATLAEIYSRDAGTTKRLSFPLWHIILCV